MNKLFEFLISLFKGKKHNADPNQTKIVPYTTPRGIIINVELRNKNVWLSQKGMSELFDVEHQTIIYHLKNIYESGELSEEKTCQNFQQVCQEGEDEVNRSIQFYNSDVIISVGYHIDSKKATKFRIWINNVLREICKN